MLFSGLAAANIHGISPVICLGGNRAKKRCPIALIDGIQSSTGQGASSLEKIYKVKGGGRSDKIGNFSQIFSYFYFDASP